LLGLGALDSRQGEFAARELATVLGLRQAVARDRERQPDDIGVPAGAWTG